MERIGGRRNGLERVRAASQPGERRLAGAAPGAQTAAMSTSPRPSAASDAEPRVAAGLAPFVDGDFHVLSPALARDPQYNDRRLELRRKLLALGKVFQERARAAGVTLDVRSSLHQPHAFNHNQVKRMWLYVTRDKQEKGRLKRTLGADLAKDLDASYRNAYLCVALEHDALEISLRIHADAWFDGQNLVNRTKKEGLAVWLALLNALDGPRLRLADWKGEWICGKLTREKLEEFLKYYQPAEHALAIERRLPAPPGARAAVLAPEVPERIVQELEALLPLYRFSAWSTESDFLFGGGSGT